MSNLEIQSDEFSLAKEFYQSLYSDSVTELQHPEAGDLKLTSKVKITNENKEVWQKFEDNSLCAILDSDGNLQVGKTYKIERNPSHYTPKGIFANDLDVVRKSGLDSIKNGQFYIGNLDYCHQNSAVQPKDVIALINLERIKTFLERFSNWPDKNRVVFFASDSIEIELNLEPKMYDQGLKDVLSSQETTKNLELTEEWLAEKGSTETHRAQRKAVVANTLLDMLKEIPASDRFIACIRSFNQIVQRSQKSYALYMENFSYSIFEKQLSEKAINFYEKISKSVLDIRNQILSLPVSFILYSFLRTKAEIDGWFIHGMTIYCVFLLVIIYQQIVYLEDIKLEVKRFYESFHKITDSNIRAEIDELNKSLTTRAKVQNKILSATFISVATVAIALIFSQFELVHFNDYLLELLENVQSFISSSVHLLTELQVPQELSCKTNGQSVIDWPFFYA